MADAATTHFLHELNAAQCAVPFQFLGLHDAPDGKGLVLRCWRPETDWVEVFDLEARRNLGRMTRVGDSDLFIKRLPRRRHTFAYRLRLGAGDRVREDDDPYQFRRSVFARMPEDRNRLYRHFGSHALSLESEAGRALEGVRFMVHAPAARSVSVVGDFNNWDGRRHPMQSSYEGSWRLFIPGLKPGTLYKYEIKGPDGELLPLKADPLRPFLNEQLAGQCLDRVRRRVPARTGRTDHWMMATPRRGLSQQSADLAVYELPSSASCASPRTGGRCPYLCGARRQSWWLTCMPMGFTHVEFMPHDGTSLRRLLGLPADSGCSRPDEPLRPA
jgi:1,4-alpha-glucan branching enzyme